MKTYKIYMQYDDIDQMQREEILKKIKGEFGPNENIKHDKYYPYFYNDQFYFGSPIVLTNVNEVETKQVIEFFAKHGAKEYRINYRYRTYSLEELQKEKIDITSIKTLNNKQVFLSDRSKIFISIICVK